MNITKQKREDLYSIVEQHAKFQKVMLIYDQFTSNLEIDKVYQQIKGLCIFNKIEISSENLNEIYNGYRLLIFMCEPSSFLSVDLNLTEFINVFLCGAEILPFCVNSSGKLVDAKLIFLPNTNAVDSCAFSSLTFNKFYNYIESIYTQTEQENEFKIDEISPRNLINILNSTPQDFTFADILLLRASKLSYSYLPAVDYILLAGLDTFFMSVKQHTLCMADMYKSIRENAQMIDKFYALTQNDAMLAMVEFNYAQIKQKLDECVLNSKQFLLPTLSVDEVKTLVESVQDYSKTSTGLLNYLYLYNIFKLN